MARFALALLSAAVGHAANISDAFLGTWTPINHTTAHSPMGPSGLFKNFAMTRDESNGDHWFSAITGQVFRVSDDLMQYCFAHAASSPFVVDSVEERKLVFCYETGKRMPTHKATASGLATGCDAAQIIIELLSDGNLEFTFMMSPPIKHAWAVFELTGAAPPVQTYIDNNLGDGCDPKNPDPPTLAASRPTAGQLAASMCPSVALKRGSPQVAATADADAAVFCRQLDAGSWSADGPTERVDIRWQYTTPTAPCWPCNVSYAVSAAIEDDQYVAVGFKGMAYRYYPRTLERPNYFGMGTDDVDETRTSRVMVLGHASALGGCVRELKAEGYVGAVDDVAGNPHLFNESVERTNGRTVLRFTIEQHVGNTTDDIRSFFGRNLIADIEQHSARLMWAVGKVSTAPPVEGYACSVCAHIYDADADGGGLAFEDLPETWLCPVCGQPKSAYGPTGVASEGDADACKAQLLYHDASRGVSPLAWFNQNPRCKADIPEMGGDVGQGLTLV